MVHMEPAQLDTMWNVTVSLLRSFAMGSYVLAVQAPAFKIWVTFTLDAAVLASGCWTQGGLPAEHKLCK